MCIKHYIANSLLLLTLFSSQASLAISAGIATSIMDEKKKTTKWQSIPEDAAKWPREPFKNSESIRSVTGSIEKIGSLTGTQTSLTLQGIMKSNNRYYAILNGRTVKLGDKIMEWNVSEISRYRVTLRRDKEQLIYDIYQGKIDRGNR